MIDTSAQMVNREHCSLNFTSPESCLCNAAKKWQSQTKVYSTLRLLLDNCNSVSSYITIDAVNHCIIQKCKDENVVNPTITNKTLDERRTLLATENAKLKGTINWTVVHVCSAEDRRARSQPLCMTQKVLKLAYSLMFFSVDAAQLWM